MNISLKGYAAVKIIAELEFKDNEYVEPFFQNIPIKNEDGTISTKKNPNYPYKTSEEERIARHKHEQKRREIHI